MIQMELIFDNIIPTSNIFEKEEKIENPMEMINNLFFSKN